MKKKNVVCDVALECLDLCNIRAVAPNNSMYFHSVNQWYWGVCIFAVRTVAPNDSIYFYSVNQYSCKKNLLYK